MQDIIINYVYSPLIHRFLPGNKVTNNAQAIPKSRPMTASLGPWNTTVNKSCSGLKVMPKRMVKPGNREKLNKFHKACHLFYMSLKNRSCLY